MERHGGNINGHHQAEAAKLKGLLTVPFELYHILEKTKLGRQKKVSGCPDGGRGE